MQREQRDDDAAWQAIVDNYGDRVLDPADDPSAHPAGPASDVAEDVPDDDGPADRPTGRAPDVGAGTRADETGTDGSEDVDPWDEFVPPTPPPLPRPRPDRLLAWLGVFGAPAVLLLVVVTGVGLPSLLGGILVASFVAGFGYLVLTMPSAPRDPWDDGAQI